MVKYLLVFFASLYLADGASECFSCGYLIDDWKEDGSNVQHAMTDGTPQCGDEAMMNDNLVSCADEGECCGVVREFYVTEASHGLPEWINVEVRHGCEKNLTQQFSDGIQEFICKSGTGTENECFNLTYTNNGGRESTFADVCFCNEDKCNRDVPVMPDPTEAPGPGPDNTTPCPECVKCYSCGYMKNGDSETGPLGGDVPFCNDFANADDNLANCGKDDCCGMLKEYFIKIDEATGENSTQIVGRHGCAADMEHLSHYSATCKENGESCWQVDDAQLDHDHGQGNVTIVEAEICLCGRDRCNNDDPIPEVPTTTAAPGSASQATFALLLLVSPLLLL
jgi:hypothetical protein